MSCRDWEERIALYAGGDLEPAEAGEVEEHLRNCVECWESADTLRAGLGLLRQAHREEIAPADFAAVRAGVLDRLDGPPGRTRRWIYAPVLGVAAAAVLALALWPRVPAPPPIARVEIPPAPAWVAPQRKPAGIAVAPSRAARQGENRPGRQPAFPPDSSPAPDGQIHAARTMVPGAQPAPAASAQPLVVKLVTNDPNVVIYWIADSKGE